MRTNFGALDALGANRLCRVVVDRVKLWTVLGEMDSLEGGRWVALAFCLVSCGRTHGDLLADAGGEAGATAGPSCTLGPSLSEATAAAPEPLPTSLDGTLCGTGDRRWVAFDLENTETNPAVVSARLTDGSAAGDYTVTLWGVEQGRLQPLLDGTLPQSFTLNAEAPELLLVPWPRGSVAGRVVLELTGPAGPVVVELARPELPPYGDCTGRYEALSTAMPTVSLPTLLEAELCNARDSRTWGVEVLAGRTVSVTLENPLSIDDFRFGVYRLDVEGYEPLPITGGITDVRLGLYAERSFSFTPARSGSVGLSAASGISRVEPPRLRVEQAP